MKQEVSKSRSLRRRLLTALISCLLIVVVICTLIFHLVYRQSVKNVDKHFSAFSESTFRDVSHTLCADDLECLLTVLHSYCNELKLEWLMLKEDISQVDYELYIRQKARTYFTDHFLPATVFFMKDQSGLKVYNLSDDFEENPSVLQDAAAAIDSDEQESEYPMFESFLDYLSESTETEEGNGRYTLNGEGYVVVWDNISNYWDHPCIVGLIEAETNDWKGNLYDVTQWEAEELNGKMNSLFRKYIQVMLVAIGAVVAVFIPISAILSRKLAAPVVSEHEMLVQVNEMKTAFLSDASHELKTPLAAMSGYAQNAELELKNGGDPVEIQEKLRRISSEANRMALMVTQILDATRIEEGRMVLEKAPCDLDSLVRETIETYFAVLNKNHNRLIIRIPPELPRFEADQSRLQRVFVNLISNALKHTKEGTILIKAEAESDHLTVTVSDTGCGISPEDLPHIWERYYKGKQSETGTGLGLFICKFIIESHGGTIRAESETGKGTSFIFTLPLANPELPDTDV